MAFTDIDKILYTAIITYILAMLLIIIIKPHFIYDKQNGKFRNYGSKEEETFIALPIMGSVLCVLIYLLVMVYTFILVKLR